MRQNRLLKRHRKRLTQKGAVMGARDGKSYISGLKAHPREVWVSGRKVTDVTADPVFRSPIAAMARLYDMQSDAGIALDHDVFAG
jgi:aromatic ring hydroxylase